MAEIEVLYDTHMSENGPWLLSEASLRELDEAVNAEWEFSGAS